MIRGTTPTLILKIPGRDLRECEIIVTFKGTTKTMNKKNDDIEITYENEATSLGIFLTQQETLAYQAGKVSIQVNWLYSNGVREATNIVEIDMKANLYGKVMVNE